MLPFFTVVSVGAVGWIGYREWQRRHGTRSNPRERVGHRTPKQARTAAIGAGRYDRVRHALDGVASQAFSNRYGALEGRPDPYERGPRMLDQHRDIARPYGATEAEIFNAESVGTERADSRYSGRK